MFKFRFTTCLILVFFISSFANEIQSQQSDFFVVRNTILTGNKKTKDKIIFRELDFVEGDTIYLNSITNRFNENIKRILSTGMFTLAKINIKNWDQDTKLADLEILLTENWYIWPAPIFELADRNFNVWWNEQNKSLDRVNYGARLTHINFTGNRDAFRALFHFGYTRKFEIRYTNPFINEKQTIGLSGNIFYSDAKEIGYITRLNKTLYAKNEDDILRTRFRINGSMEYRPGLNLYHRLNLAFHHNTIDDYVVTDLNPDYFLDGKTGIKFFVLEYQFRWDKRVFQFYPEGGFAFDVNIKKEGLGLFGDFNNLSVSSSVEKYIKFNDWIIMGTRVKGKTNLIRSKVSFANNTGLGYGDDFLRGYELFVIDGTDYVYAKSSIKFNLFEKIIGINKAMPINAFKKMQIQVFASLNLDIGYVNERDYVTDNFFNNRWLYGYGPGLDIILYNNYLLKFEYSFNHQSIGGLFFSNRINF